MHPIASLLIENDISTIYKKFLELEKEGLVWVTYKDNFALIKYSKECQYKRYWNEYTSIARGLILDIVNNRLIALPFPKILNHSEVPSSVWINQQVESVQEKLDGSLGIIYHDGNDWAVATTGSFNSEQGKVCLNLIQPIKHSFPLNHTILVEIIYPENRIVLDYGNQTKLVYLTSYDHSTFKEVDHSALFAHHPYTFPTKTNLLSVLQGLENQNAEGFMVKFVDGTRLKFKTESYLALHRLLTDITKRKVWDLYALNGYSKTKTLEMYPNEFLKEILEYLDKFEFDFQSNLTEVLDNYDAYKQLSKTRKEFASLVSRHNSIVQSALFSMYDGKSYENIVKQIRYGIQP
jgi:RNA ligase